MCIVIDTNTLASVFVRSSARHNEFKPVLDWIEFGRGQIVYGGSKYLHEIQRYRNVFAELRKARKAIPVSNDKIDQEMARITQLVQHRHFDDQHLVALLIISGCRLICSEDKNAYPFFTHKKFFNPLNKRPKIYSRSSNRNLLNDRNMAEICLPSGTTTNDQRNLIQRLLN